VGKLCSDGIIRARLICSWESEYFERYPEAIYIQSSTNYETHFRVLGKASLLGPMDKNGVSKLEASGYLRLEPEDAESQPEKGYSIAIPDDGELYSTIISLSRATHGWLYDYANYAPDYPGATLEGFPIWPERRPKVYKYWEPGDDEKQIWKR
jgi:hypothetical protein